MPTPCPSTVSPELLVFAALARSHSEAEARQELSARRAADAALAERSAAYRNVRHLTPASGHS